MFVCSFVRSFVCLFVCHDDDDDDEEEEEAVHAVVLDMFLLAAGVGAVVSAAWLSVVQNRKRLNGSTWVTGKLGNWVYRWFTY